MFVIPSGGNELPEIPHSLRASASASTYLSKTLGGGNTKKWTLSFWAKFIPTGSTQCIAFAGVGTQPYTSIGFSSDGEFSFDDIVPTNTIVGRKTLSGKLRDYSAFSHYVIVWDTANASASDRMQIYINGVRITSFSASTDPALNADSNFNSAVAHRLMSNPTYGQYGDGYLARIAFVDGEALDPSDFAFTDRNGQWRSKHIGTINNVVYAGGVNSFLLEFNDGTSTTTLGNDYSSKNNDWTLTNFTRAAGINDCWTIDTPTNNFCTLNPIDKRETTSSYATVSAGGLNVYMQHDPGVNAAVRASLGASSNKWYWEITLGSREERVDWQGTMAFGVATARATVDNSTGWGVATGTDGWCLYWSWTSNELALTHNGVTTALVNNAADEIGDTIQMALDADSKKLWIGKNGVWIYGDPSAGSGALVTGLASDGLLPTISLGEGSGSATYATAYMNFGSAPLHASATYHASAGGYFRYTPPTGYKALNTKNIPKPAVKKSQSAFDINVRVAQTAPSTVIGMLFKPDLVWTKSRSASTSHKLTDVVRGVTKALSVDLSSTEVTETGGITTFNSDGYVIGSDSDYNNTTGPQTYVDWCWRANGTGVANANGGIASVVSANTSSGVSVVAYTGSGAASTVGHGLSSVPKLIIVKRRSNADDWVVYHASMGATGGMAINLTDGFQAQSGWWNDTAPTSTVFSVGGSPQPNYASTNFLGNTYIAYCFSEVVGFSKFGAYTGNGNSDGVFVNCGFKPAFVLTKRMDAGTTQNWTIVDSSRDPDNPNGTRLYANSTAADDTATSNVVDLVANGFKFRNGADANYNGSGAIYVYAAFAEQPFKYYPQYGVSSGDSDMLFTVSSSYTVPSGVTTVIVSGAGGGGGYLYLGDNISFRTWSGGGAASVSKLLYVQAGDVISFTIGTGGSSAWNWEGGSATAGAGGSTVITHTRSAVTQWTATCAGGGGESGSASDIYSPGAYENLGGVGAGDSVSGANGSSAQVGFPAGGAAVYSYNGYGNGANGAAPGGNNGYGGYVRIQSF